MIIHCLYEKLVPLDELKPNPNNRNKHPKEQIKRLAEVLKYQGWRYCVKVSKQSGFVTSGHGRIEAARLNGWDSVPVNYQDYETPEQEYADSVSDNAIASWAELDLAGINEDILKMGPDFKLELLGIADFKLIDEPEEEEQGDNDSPFLDGDDDRDKEDEEEDQADEIPDKIEPRVKHGESYKIGEHKIFNGDCLKILKTLDSNSLDSLVTDPPAGIAFMGKEWDEDKGGSKEWIAWMSSVMRECLRVLKPGAHGLVWAIPRTSHWTATALEDAGFEIRDVVTHIFGSGFPKSLDISKAIDKAAGAKGEIIEQRDPGLVYGISKSRVEQGARPNITVSDGAIRAPATPEAKQWQGWGTALKPASEHWILVRKPLGEKTVAANVLKHGTGGINIDASRIDCEPRITTRVKIDNSISSGKMGIMGMQVPEDKKERYEVLDNKGRFPSNLILSHNPDCVEVGVKNVKLNGSGKCSGNTTKDKSMFGIGSHELSHGNSDGTETVAAWECTEGCAVAMLDAQSVAGGMHSAGNKRAPGTSIQTKDLTNRVSWDAGHSPNNGVRFGDSGGASRFFYCAKASKADKGKSNIHPTVKSVKLMQYLITLVTPEGGTLLDCFGGSGTTLVAAHLKAFSAVLIEQNPEYCDIILARAEYVTEKSAINVKA